MTLLCCCCVRCCAQAGKANELTVAKVAANARLMPVCPGNSGSHAPTSRNSICVHLRPNLIVPSTTWACSPFFHRYQDSHPSITLLPHSLSPILGPPNGSRTCISHVLDWPAAIPPAAACIAEKQTTALLLWLSPQQASMHSAASMVRLRISEEDQ
jgi:hypothetical protein